MVTDAQRESLEAEIRAAFAGATRPSKEQIAPHDCDECAELRSAFTYVSWDAMPDPLVEAHALALPLLSPKAFAYFLPGYLLYALKHLTWQFAPSQMTVYAIGPGPTHSDVLRDWERERLKPFTDAQARVIDKFLQLVEQDDEFGGYLGDVTERRARFQELWASRWSA
jgi:hypothetical protein